MINIVKLMELINEYNDQPLDVDLVYGVVLDENQKMINAVSPRHRNTDGNWYAILIRDYYGTRNGKVRNEGNTIKWAKGRKSQGEGMPLIVKDTAYAAADGTRTSVDDKFKEQYEDLPREIKKYAKNFVYDNQDLLIRYYHSTDADEQSDIINSIVDNMKSKNYEKANIKPKTQKELDELLNNLEN